MKGVIASFRGSLKRRRGNQVIVQADKVDSKAKAEKLVGKEVVWKTPGKKGVEIKGKISAVHGRNGAVRVIFEKGMPGQSLGTQIQIA